MNKKYSVTVCLLSAILMAVLLTACNPEAKWTTKDVTIDINPYTVSAGFVECSFTPNKNTYYLIACQPVQEGYDPMTPEHQKQFMTMALDSAKQAYLDWRQWILKEGHFTIAPFSSHSLQYGNVDHFFTNLMPQTDYWIYAFVVDPEKEAPVGKLHLKTITTKDHSIADVHFDYRVRGLWDYIYPLNPDGKINNHYPYLATTVDSADLVELYDSITFQEYFLAYFLAVAEMDYKEAVRFGVQAVYNDGWTGAHFQEGHTYYTGIISYDGFMGNGVVYRFLWTGENYEAYFKDEDSIIGGGEND